VKSIECRVAPDRDEQENGTYARLIYAAAITRGG
jgi:hypothetical protein